MTTTLTTLIKLQKKAVEDVQMDLAHNQRAQEATKDKIRLWQREAETAFADGLAEGDVRSVQAAGAFQGRAQQNIKDCERQLVELQAAEATLRIDLQTAFAAQKRYEILAEQQAAKLAKHRAKKAQNNLDELGGRKR
jgi:flagellar export protein FliJ